MNELMVLLIAGIAALAYILGWLTRVTIGKHKLADAEQMAEKILSDAENEAEALKKTKILEAKDEWYRRKQTFENETRRQKNELQRLERRLYQSETNIDRRADLLKKKEQEFDQTERNLRNLKQELDQKNQELNRLIQEQNRKLEEISGMTRSEAKQILIDSMKKEAESDAVQLIKEVRDQARLTAHREAKEVVIQAIQRAAMTHAVETTVSVVHLPADDMKGRIIGREGRNIRSFEMQTGVEVIVDDTPEAILLSGFDPVQREIAKIAMEKLISDGRIHPGRIEDVVEKARTEFEERIQEVGEQTMLETGVHGLHPDLVRLLGKLKYRTTYGQNVLQHSIEVSHLAGIMAAQLGLDVLQAKRAGLLHDIGKTSDNYTEGTLSEIGIEIVRKYG
ncbi:MAG TPA: ribonuclease Y, partial [Bacteroidetes bacterium]|nr:ribonuclease Y [Bacteroidota bacterium]